MNVKQLRLLTELTQKEFCSKYEIPLKTLQNWEAHSEIASSRVCPAYVVSLLEKAVINDFPIADRLIKAKTDESHLASINLAKKKIRKSPLLPYVKDVLLYGSTARGQAKQSSDIDILLVLKESLKEKKKSNEWISYLKGNISSDDFNTPETDLHVVFGDNWKDSNDAYFENIKEEGFSIWN